LDEEKIKTCWFGSCKNGFGSAQLHSLFAVAGKRRSVLHLLKRV
jgi:hypothetical protein